MKNLSTLAFILAALLNLIGEAFAYSSLVVTTKPLLMPLLIAWLLTATNHSSNQSFLRRIVIAALVFSTLGDVFLMFSGEMFFLLGLGFFLLAHLFYVVAFSTVSSFKNGSLKQNPWWGIPFLIFPVLLLTFLWNGIPPGMRLPVAAYAGVISVMALSVVNLRGKVADAIFLNLLAGAILFLISDSLLAVAKFGEPFEGSRWAIMLTYIGGQFLLVRGVVEVLKSSYKRQ